MSSMFASQVTKVVEVPGYEPATMTVRKLSGSQYAEVIGLFKADSPLWRNKAIEYGVTGWSLNVPRTPDAMRDLVDEVVDAVALEVVKLTKPSWFTSPEVQADERKNDSGASTLHS